MHLQPFVHSVLIPWLDREFAVPLLSLNLGRDEGTDANGGAGARLFLGGILVVTCSLPILAAGIGPVTLFWPHPEGIPYTTDWFGLGVGIVGAFICCLFILALAALSFWS